MKEVSAIILSSKDYDQFRRLVEENLPNIRYIADIGDQAVIHLFKEDLKNVTAVLEKNQLHFVVGESKKTEDEINLGIDTFL